MSADRWQAPWFAALRPTLDTVGDDALAGRWGVCIDRLNDIATARGVVNANGRAIRFVDACRVDSSSYESHIWRTGEVPTRTDAAGGWHDLFNALVWIAYPRIKGALNRLQSEAIERDGVQSTRGQLRDAATLFDENAVLLFTSNRELVGALREFDWDALFVRHREAFVRDVRVVAFGHALIDKLRQPYKAICAHAWIVEPGAPNSPNRPDPVDNAIAATLTGQSLRASAFAPLPVLGIPGWWPMNRDPGFYGDTRVFRARRVRAAAPTAVLE